MSDSDETVCDNDEYGDHIPESDTQDSPSIISGVVLTPNPAPSKNNADHDHGTLHRTAAMSLSPEYPPPSAKLKRIDGPITSNTFDITMATTDTHRSTSKDSSVSSNQIGDKLISSMRPADASLGLQRTNEPSPSYPDEVCAKESSVAEDSKLRNIRKQENEAEELIISLEKKEMAGSDLMKSPIFFKAKGSLAVVQQQLAEFSQLQQQERSKLTACQAPQTESECSKVAWSLEDKQSLQQLADKQRELLKLCRKHKELVGRLQSMKHADRPSKEHVLPHVEKHLKSTGGEGLCDKDLVSKSGVYAAASSSHSYRMPEPVQALCDRAGSNPNTSTRISALEVGSQLMQLPVIQPLTSSSVVSVQGSANMHPAMQQVLLTGGQLYQIGSQQVYVMPKTAPPTTVPAIRASVTQTSIITAGKTSKATASQTRKAPAVMMTATAPVTAITTPVVFSLSSQSNTTSSHVFPPAKYPVITRSPPTITTTTPVAATVITTSVVFSQPGQQNITSTQSCNTTLTLPPARSPLMTCHQPLSILLRNCYIMPISDEELFPSNSILPPDFWTAKGEVNLPTSMIKELDF